MVAIGIRSVGPGVELWTRGDRSLTVFTEPVTDDAKQAALADRAAAVADWAIDHNDRLYTLKYGKPDRPINIYTLREAGRLPVGRKGSTASQRREVSKYRRRTEIMETGGSRFFDSGDYEPRPGTAAERRLKRQVIRERAAEQAGARTITTGGELVEPRRRKTHRQVFWPGFGE